MEESYAGPHADMLVSQSAGFPLKYVGWSLPGLAWGLRSDRQALEIQQHKGVVSQTPLPHQSLGVTTT